MLPLAVAATAAATAMVIIGGPASWLFERRTPGSTFGSCVFLWWALTTPTTVGYRDHARCV
jgi:hypothetical protein